MSYNNVDELRQLLVQLKLVEESQLDECLSRLEPKRRRPADFLQTLGNQHLLTSYQVGRLVRGRADALVLGNFKLMYRNASGSFARVFRACAMADGRMVGLKLLRQRWAQDVRMVSQFRREAELCKKLRHKNIVPIYEVGSQRDYHYFTMEFIEGGNLRDFLQIRGKLSAVEATRCALDMAEGLEYSLRLGITHRDMKLTNVLMSSRGVAKLVDFGLAGDYGLSGTSSGDGIFRALEYATLEKGTNAPNDDPRSDLYFLGAIYYELLTGTPPYTRTHSRAERKKFSRYSTIRPIYKHDPNLPRPIVQIVERLMELNPFQRYQAPQEVIADLRCAMNGFGEASLSNGRGSGPFRKPVAVESEKSLPTVMCIENRVKQQDLLRDYLSKHGFRVLVLSDVERGLIRLRTNPPDCVILMGEAIGERVGGAFAEASRLGEAAKFVTLAILGEKQALETQQLQQTPTGRVMIQPVTLRDLRREIHLTFQR